MEIYKEEKQTIKSCEFLSEVEVNEQFGRNMNQDTSEKRRCSGRKWVRWDGGEMRSSDGIKDRTGRLEVGENTIRKN